VGLDPRPAESTQIKSAGLLGPLTVHLKAGRSLQPSAGTRGRLGASGRRWCGGLENLLGAMLRPLAVNGPGRQCPLDRALGQRPCRDPFTSVHWIFCLKQRRNAPGRINCCDSAGVIELVPMSRPRMAQRRCAAPGGLGRLAPIEGPAQTASLAIQAIGSHPEQQNDRQTTGSP